MKTIIRVVLLSLIVFSVFTTCDSSPGMGDSIDWEAPILTMDPVPNPLYVRQGMALTGTATDNVGVTRIIFIDISTGEELLPVTRDGDNWRIDLTFSEELNGKKIVAQVIAYDRGGNTGAQSIAFVTMIIDIREPIVEYMDIKRTDSRMASLLPYSELKALEKTPTDRKSDLFKYQNGWFYINGIVNDEDTKVQVISLELYDSMAINTVLLSLDIDEGYTPYFPRWTVKEEDIINSGAKVFGDNYKTDYYKNNARYYYRVVIKAIDMSGNENQIIEEDEGYICLWAESDKPKGIIDPGVGKEVSKGTPFPIDLYDDDAVLWAFTGLLTYDQWIGKEEVAPSTTIDFGSPAPDLYRPDIEEDFYKDKDNTNKKLNWLKERLTGSKGDSVALVTPGSDNVVYNWMYDKHTATVTAADIIADQIKGSNLDEKLVYVQTPNLEADCGNYILFTIVADKKLSPHDGKGPEWTNKNIWVGKADFVKVKDENAPLIVFDTDKKPVNGEPTKLWCPEENTFPDPLIDGEYFDIVGYTLRENGGGGNNLVEKFRMAWIPYNMPGGADSYISAVQKALSADNNLDSDKNYPATIDKNSDLTGIQHWEFVQGGGSGFGNFIDDGNVDDKGDHNADSKLNTYRRQLFTKRFSVMGKPDDIKPAAYKNFHYDYKRADGTPGRDGITELENDTKLFIFYAIDNMGHEVFRQLRLLGLQDKPVLHIYDISNSITEMPGKTTTPSVANDIPNPTVSGNTNPGSGEPTALYYSALTTYNNYTEVKSKLNGVLAGKTPTQKEDYEAESFKIYPRGTIVKFTVEAPQTGKIPIDNITMKDITFATNDSLPIFVGSGYDSTAKTYSFCEYYPDVTQRTFLFEATDLLGNIKSIQRTIAVSNAAQLESITTTEQNGTYGHGKIITLSANFTSQIYLARDNDGNPIQNDSQKPKLNVRYQLDGSSNWNYMSIICSNSPTKSSPSINLNFNFEVPENAKGTLETLFSRSYIGGSPLPADGADIPITLPGDSKIMDYTRDGAAFIPGYSSDSVSMPNWENKNKTLQAQKTITLDGVHPILGTPTWGGKNAYTGAPNNYYFKVGETIELTISATNKAIRASGATPVLKYRIKDSSGADRPSSSGHYINGFFKYMKPGTGNTLIYSLTVDSASCPYDGELTDVILDTSDGRIEDSAENIIYTLNSSSIPVNGISTTNLIPSGTRIFIKKTVPDAPPATFGGVAFTSPTFQTNYNTPKNLVIPDSISTGPGGITWEEVKEYVDPATNSWKTYTDTPPITITTDGTYNLQARYKDRAGNEGKVASKTIVMNLKFPNLVSVNAVQPNGTYIKNSNLTFQLNFADKVTVTNASNVKITIENRLPAASNNAAINKIDLTAQAATNTSTISFNLAGISNLEMREGVYISGVTLTGLTDAYGNIGGTGAGSSSDFDVFTGAANITSSKNLAKGIIIDAIDPTVKDRDPAITATPSGNNLIKELKITFSEPVMLGKGIITIRPRGNYAIPPVLDDTGYYLGYTTNGLPTGGSEIQTGAPAKFTSAGPSNNNNRTYISSFYDIYNAIPSAPGGGTVTQAALREYLAAGTSMSALTEKARSGLNTGPYIKMTQGLTPGWGHTGNYSNTPSTASGVNAPSPSSGFLVPDTATKWVLDYQYGIAQNVAAVNNIRTALTHAKWRWQEIDVVSASVGGTGDDLNRVVTIPLNEPLLKGLEWEVYYPKGTFTDLAGNDAPASGITNANPTSWSNNDYYFTSPGVQAPVIRVNRRSSDSRGSDWTNRKTFDTITDNTNTIAGNTSWANINTVINDTIGWSADNFKYVHFRVESESPGATVTAKSLKGTGSGYGAITGAWSGSVRTNNSTGTGFTNMTWEQNASNTAGEWVLPNLIRRSRDSANSYYDVTNKNGIVERRTQPAVDLRMYKSYNRDVTAGDLSYPTGAESGLTAISLSSNAATKGQAYLDFGELEANKSYIVGTASLNDGTSKGIEGVFRTVIMLNHGTSRRNSFMAVEGSNIKNGIPSIAGFPVRDADESDCRYLKAFFDVSPSTPTTSNFTQYYWVSTEIVCEWYFILWGGGQNPNNGTHMTSGEVNNYLMVGYGDLTYGYNLVQNYGLAY
jgi:hypothetical protein